MKKMIYIIIIAVTFIIIVVSISCNNWQREQSGKEIQNAMESALGVTQQDSQSIPESNDIQSQVTLTLDKYRQIQNGMSLSQVENILGVAGTLSSSSGGYDFYVWGDYSSGMINVTIDIETKTVVYTQEVGLN